MRHLILAFAIIGLLAGCAGSKKIVKLSPVIAGMTGTEISCTTEVGVDFGMIDCGFTLAGEIGDIKNRALGACVLVTGDSGKCLIAVVENEWTPDLSRYPGIKMACNVTVDPVSGSGNASCSFDLDGNAKTTVARIIGSCILLSGDASKCLINSKE